MSKTMGQALDDFLEDTHDVESVYIYYNDRAEPQVVVLRTEQDYDFTQVITEHHDLNAEIELKRKEVVALQQKIRGFETTRKSVEKAISTLVKHSAPKPKKEGK